MTGRITEDSWLVWWTDEDEDGETPQDHDSFRTAREEISEELTCRMRDIDIDEDINDLYDEYHDARIDVNEWREDGGPKWAIEVDGVTFNIEYVLGGAYH